MKPVGIGLFVLGGLIFAAAAAAAVLTAADGESVNVPILVGGIVLGSMFDVGGIIAMKFL